MGGRRKPKDKRLSEAELIAITGISRRELTRRRQQGLILAIEPRHGLGRGRGTTSLEYPLTAIATIKRLNELSQTFKDVGERRWRLWLEGKPVRIAPDLADTLGQFKAVRSEIKTLSDIETKIPASVWKPANMPRGHPLRRILRGLSDDDLHSLTTLLICVAVGIRLPVFDEPNPSPFQIFKRAVGLPKERQMPAGFFESFRTCTSRSKMRLSSPRPASWTGQGPRAGSCPAFSTTPRIGDAALSSSVALPTVAADQARQFDVAVTSRARRDRRPHHPRNAGLQVCASRRGYGSLHFNRERDEQLVAEVRVMGLCRDQLLDRIGYGSYGPNKTEN